MIDAKQPEGSPGVLFAQWCAKVTASLRVYCTVSGRMNATAVQCHCPQQGQASWPWPHEPF